MENKLYEFTYLNDGKECKETIKASTMSTVAMYVEDILKLDIQNIRQIV